MGAKHCPYSYCTRNECIASSPVKAKEKYKQLKDENKKLKKKVGDLRAAGESF